MQITFDVPERILHELLDGVELPPMACIRYTQPTPDRIDDVDSEVRRRLRDVNLRALIRPGQRVAIGVGSRGIGRLPELVAATVSEIRAAGGQPFIVPSMGSHGGATADGQREVLHHLGVTEESVGAPIRSQMETAVVGETADGMPVHLDRLALEADAIVLVVRIKPHTAFRGPYESGLAKMIAIGLGKQRGAGMTHARGFGEMHHMVPEMAEVALKKAPIRLGVAVLENAHDQPFKIVAIPADRIMEEEPALLEEARAAMPRLPFDRIDVLVIDQIGKNISGDGADPNVTGRYPTPDACGGPVVSKQVILNLTDASRGNGNGIGTSDFTTLRFARKLSLADTYPNALTSTVPGPVKVPMVLPSDKLAMQAALLTCNAVGRAPRVVRIRDTLHLEEMWISEGLLDEACQSSSICVVRDPGPLQFDAGGNLTDLPSV